MLFAYYSYVGAWPMRLDTASAPELPLAEFRCTRWQRKLNLSGISLKAFEQVTFVGVENQSGTRTRYGKELENKNIIDVTF